MVAFGVDFDVLYWQAGMDGLDSAILQSGTFKQPHFEWDPGFRIAFAVKTAHDAWAYSLTFTHLHTKARDDTDSPGMVPIWTSPQFTGSSTVDAMHDRWRLHMGLLDLEMHKRIPVTSWLALEPTLGVSYGMIRQKFKIVYSGGTLMPDGEDVIQTKNKFWGIGPRVSLLEEWRLYKKLYLMTSQACRVLSGEFYIHESEKASLAPERRLRLMHVFAATEPIYSLGLALTWRETHWDVHGGYEEHFFFTQNQRVRFLNPNFQGAFVSHLGDLTLQGFTLGGSYIF